MFPELTGSSSNPYDPYKVSSVLLPDGVRQFQFAYNVYGELARTVLPPILVAILLRVSEEASVSELAASEAPEMGDRQFVVAA